MPSNMDERRTITYPPIWVLEKLEKYLDIHGGTKSKFIATAISEKLEREMEKDKNENKVSFVLKSKISMLGNK